MAGHNQQINARRRSGERGIAGGVGPCSRECAAADVGKSDRQAGCTAIADCLACERVAAASIVDDGFYAGRRAECDSLFVGSTGAVAFGISSTNFVDEGAYVLRQFGDSEACGVADGEVVVAVEADYSASERDFDIIDGDVAF